MPRNKDVVEHAVDLWENGIVFKYSLHKIIYTRTRKIHTLHPETCDEVRNIPKVANIEKSYLLSQTKTLEPPKMILLVQK